ncbi:MAG TPA: AmmeMemoRadiSam system radical SAM enzyme [Candidatus Nanoarchaeia archaeon]|nr:AmmeMemoRadiSam system radical SAM enzyme [Candidatus Nanoarchaeia archaeon]
MKEAMFYNKLKDKVVNCRLCPHYCVIDPDGIGKCGVRQNIDGKLFSLVYGKIISSAVDPIEKKPLFNFLPGTKSYSIATAGCNLFCEFCQNWEISQLPKTEGVRGFDMEPAEIVEDALKKGCQSIAYTYTEPTIFLEYALDIAKIARKKKLKNIFVTNGFITTEAAAEASKVIDAANVDLKGFTDDYYKKVCGARLKPVLDAIRTYYDNGVWLEITTLIVPGHNDSPEMLTRIAEFIASVDKKIPWHISRFFPHYKMLSAKPTPVETVIHAVNIGKKIGLKYIYGGNLMSDEHSQTLCPSCGEEVISRRGFFVEAKHIKGNVCEFCRKKIDVVE